MKHHFPRPLRTELYGYRGQSEVLILTAPFIYVHPAFPIVTVPSHSLTDGASIPRLFWNILSPRGPYGRAAVIHDFLYSILGGIKYPKISRGKADLIFRQAVRDCGCGWWTAQTMYWAVRAFGWRSFRKAEKHIDRI